MQCNIDEVWEINTKLFGKIFPFNEYGSKCMNKIELKVFINVLWHLLFTSKVSLFFLFFYLQDFEQSPHYSLSLPVTFLVGQCWGLWPMSVLQHSKLGPLCVMAQPTSRGCGEDQLPLLFHASGEPPLPGRGYDNRHPSLTGYLCISKDHQEKIQKWGGHGTSHDQPRDIWKR